MSVRPLLLGMGWFPDQVGGLNRYFRELIESLGNARGVVLGPGESAPDFVVVAADRGDPLFTRVRRYAAAARGVAGDANVVDAHFALYAWLPVLYGPLRRLPLVVHFQGPWSDESRSVGERGIALSAKHLVERMVYRRAAAIVVLSGAFRRLLVERYRVSPWRVRVIPPGVDLKRFSPGSRADARSRFGLPNDAWVALSVRRLVPRTGVRALLESWEKARPENGLLLVAGDGPQRPELEQLGVESVRFLGAVPEAELPDLYRAADVSVVPSLELEGFGLSVLESLACGTPVIATTGGGPAEALAPLDRSLLVPPGDTAALAARLRTARAGALPGARACRAHAEQFSWRRAADRNREVYADALTPAPRPIRAVYLDHCARMSGAELALSRLLPELDGVASHVILGEDGPLVDLLLERGISVEVLPMPAAARDLPRSRVRPGGVSPASALGAAWYALRVARRLRALRPDVVHTNSLKAAIYGTVAAKLARVPLVWHVRDRIAEDYLPQSAIRLVHRLAAAPSLVFANSAATMSTVGDAVQRRAIIPSVVLFDPVATPTEGAAGAEHGFTVGMVGRLAPWKGQHVFLEAFARAFHDGDAHAVIVGAPLFGEDEYEERLHAQVRALGIEDRVEFTGHRSDVYAELARFDVLVHASVTPEPFGQVVLEGMAAGIPVVASAAGGPVEIIDTEVNGLLVTPGDVDALADTLRRLAADLALRQRLGASARIRAKDFAPEVIAARVVDAYRLLLAGRA